MNKTNKTLVVGIPPEYNYPGRIEEWSKNNTRYAANFGASFIAQSVLRQYDSEFGWDLDNPEKYRGSYDQIVIALATHIHPSRDIWKITRFVEALELPTHFISGGISDYETSVSSGVHPSVRRLLEIASQDGRYIGVRGHYTAHYLHKTGFQNAVPTGCPSIYYNCKPELHIERISNPRKIRCPYHLTVGRQVPEFFTQTDIVGQDFEDQAIFTDDLASDDTLQKWVRAQFPTVAAWETMNKAIKEKGIFPTSYNDWFEIIGSSDAVIGPRLHGCLAALVQGIPTVMTPRDLRGREVAEFYEIPSAGYHEVADRGVQEILKSSSFEKFETTYSARYKNYLAFLRENKTHSRHNHEGENVEYVPAINRRDEIVIDSLILHRQSAVSLKKEPAAPLVATKDNSIRGLIRQILKGLARRIKN